MEKEELKRTIKLDVMTLASIAGFSMNNKSESYLYSVICSKLMMYSMEHKVEEISVEKYVEIIEEIAPSLVKKEHEKGSVEYWAGEHRFKGIAADFLMCLMNPKVDDELEKLWKENEEETGGQA